MDAEKIAEKARKSISKFCIEECKAYCCRKGYLILNTNEVEEVTQGRKDELEDKKILKIIKDGRYSLYMGNYDAPCPSFKDFKCIIYNSKNRPKTCRDFPLFIDGKNVFLSPRCLAVKNGLLYPYMMQLSMLGYKILKSDAFADFEMHTVNFIDNNQRKIVKVL